MYGMELPTESETVFVLWLADLIISDGGLAWATKKILQGKNAVYADYVEISEELSSNKLNQIFDKIARGPSGRELADIALKFPHQDTIDQSCDDGSIITYPVFMFWRTRDRCLLHTSIFPHPLMVRYDGHTTRFEGSMDYEFAQKLVGDGPYTKATDSDDLILCTVSRNDRRSQVERVELTAEFMAKFLINEANLIHFELAHSVGIIHTLGKSTLCDIKHKEIISFFNQVKDQIDALKDNLDMTDIHNLLAIKSFFGPISMYASPQRQQINEQMIGKRKIP